jgi:protein-tyrosine phosphatase
MDWVAAGIAIGRRRDALDGDLVRGAGIEAILQLYGPERDPIEFAHVTHALCLYVVDGEPLSPELLTQGVSFIREQRRAERQGLVACGAGMSRSAAFVAAYLVEEGAELAVAFLTLMRRRPQIMPHPTVLRSLLEHYQVCDSFESILTQLVRERRRLLQIRTEELR